MKIHYYKQDIIDICDMKHLTVEEIFEEIAKSFPDAWKSSIYRNVEQLVDNGELRKVIWIWKKAYFEKNIFDLEENIEIKNLPKNFKTSNMDIKIFGQFS
jgi:hypothetical protein